MNIRMKLPGSFKLVVYRYTLERLAYPSCGSLENHHRLKSTGPFTNGMGDIGSFLGGYLVWWVDPHLQGHELLTFEPFQLGLEKQGKQEAAELLATDGS